MKGILTAALVAAAAIATPAEAIPPPQHFYASADTMEFGQQTVTLRSAARTVTVWNALQQPQAITSITATAPFEVLGHNCGTLQYTESCEVRVAVTPTLPAGTRISGALNIESSAGPASVLGLGVSPSRSLARHFYNAILRREPEAGGAEYWANQLAALSWMGAGPNESHYVMAGYFFNSDEYRAAGKTDIAYVQDLYATFMNREAEPLGLGYWTGQLAAGLPREMVLVSFMFSPEWEAFSAPIVGTGSQRPEADVTMDFYRGLLGRVPDGGSFAYWVGALRQAQCVGPAAVRTTIDNMASSFLASDEYVNRGRDDASHTADLYYAFLRRGADLAGFAYWLDQLDGGRMSRDEVRRAFMASPEFANRVQKVIDAGCYAG